MGSLVVLEPGRISKGPQGFSDERADEGKLDFGGLGGGAEAERAEVRAGQRQVSVGLAAAAG